MGRCTTKGAGAVFQWRQSRRQLPAFAESCCHRVIKMLALVCNFCRYVVDFRAVCRDHEVFPKAHDI